MTPGAEVYIKHIYNLPYESKEADLKNREYQQRPVPQTEPKMQ